MRHKITSFFVTIALLFLAPSLSQGQSWGGPGGFGGGGPGGFGGGGKWGGGMNTTDPEANFNILANGRTFFLATDNNRLRVPLDAFLQDRGITNGIVTKDLYLAFEKARAAGQLSGGGFGNKGPGGGNGWGGFQAGNASMEQMNQFAVMEFKRLDLNDDGQLNSQEMPSQLKDELNRWDTDHDNLINVEEFKFFFYNRYQSRNQGRVGVNVVDRFFQEEEEVDEKPTVFRLGKLPLQELPEWWKELDVEPKDGQISLYEWRTAGKAIEEFKEWDRNDDGLITPEEAMSKMRQIMIANSKVNPDDDENNNGSGQGFKGLKSKKGGPSAWPLGGFDAIPDAGSRAGWSRVASPVPKAQVNDTSDTSPAWSRDKSMGLFGRRVKDQ